MASANSQEQQLVDSIHADQAKLSHWFRCMALRKNSDQLPRIQLIMEPDFNMTIRFSCPSFEGRTGTSFALKSCPAPIKLI